MALARKSGRSLSTAEKLEIINADPVLWSANFVKIIDNNNNQIPFVFNEAQKHFWKNHGRFNVINKTRQLGMSTMMLCLMLYFSHQIPNSDYLMIADKGENTQNLFQRLKNMYDTIPDNVRVGQRRSNKYELLLENGSRISVQTAGNKEIGRGFSCQIIHLSEFAFWQSDIQERAIISLEASLLKNPAAFLCIESTANGVGDKYYDIFTGAEKGNNKYNSFFYGWGDEIGTKCHRKMFKYEIEEATEWVKATNHGQMILANKLYMTPEELKIYNNYNVTVKQICWRRYKMSGIGEDAFNQEFPLSSAHAFIQSDKGYFSAVDITERYKYLPKPLSIIEIGKDLPESVAQYYGKGLYIYQPWQRNEQYWGGIDTAAGLKLDHSTITILDSSGEQVCVFYRNDLPVYKFAQICFDLGHWFNYCMFSIERNAYGLSLIDKLRREMQYLQILRFNKFDKIKGVMTSEYGYYTDSVSKVKLLGDLKESFEIGTILVNDRETLDQMKIYVQHKNGSLGNIRGQNNFDDLVDSIALAVQSLKANVSYI